MMNSLMDAFIGKTVLVTGHTGFKGSWLSVWLSHLGANVVGASIDIVSRPSNFEASAVARLVEDKRIDITDAGIVRKLVEEVQPDFVFHLAAQSLVRTSYESPAETMLVNAIGSANVLDALRISNKKVVAIMITSDKAYDNVEWVWGYRETDSLGGADPYSASKGMAELAIRSYVESFFNLKDSKVRVGIARAGNVIGGGDWARDRLVPDSMRAWSVGQTVDIRSPLATRPWQHVLEPLSGYLVLAAKLADNTKFHSEAYNFGPMADQNFPVSDLINEMSKYWDKVRWRDTSQEKTNMHEAGLLKLNCDKANLELNWTSTMNFEETLSMTIKWYQRFYENLGRPMDEFTVSQINEFSRLAKIRKVEWAL
jgi:CDP-glucose 4,6-dehydratase